jgi:hypothetical protein
MADNTPVTMGKSGMGGARPGSGAKKNTHRIAHSELRQAIEKKLGMPYIEMLAETQVKLFKDFKNDINVRDHIRFCESISQRIIEAQTTQQVILSPVNEMSDEELKARAAALMVKFENVTGPIDSKASDQ